MTDGTKEGDRGGLPPLMARSKKLPKPNAVLDGAMAAVATSLGETETVRDQAAREPEPAAERLGRDFSLDREMAVRGVGSTPTAAGKGRKEKAPRSAPSSSADAVRIVTSVPEELFHAFKVACAQRRVTMRDVLAEAVEKFVAAKR